MAYRKMPNATGLAFIFGQMRGVIVGSALFGSLLFFNAVQVLSLITRPFSVKLFREINRNLADFWWSLCVIGAKAIRTDVMIEGDILPFKENALVVANHQAMMDIVALFFLGRANGRLGDLKWFVKHSLQYMPGAGWGLKFLDTLFVKRTWLADAGRITATFRTINEQKVPIWLIMFPEGTRLLPHKVAASHAFAKSRGIPGMDHVLIPRTKGFVASVQGLNTHIAAVYDVTIYYPAGIPKLWQFVSSWGMPVRMHVERFPLATLPPSEPELAEWLITRFKIKNERIAAWTNSP